MGHFSVSSSAGVGDGQSRKWPMGLFSVSFRPPHLLQPRGDNRDQLRSHRTLKFEHGDSGNMFSLFDVTGGLRLNNSGVTFQPRRPSEFDLAERTRKPRSAVWPNALAQPRSSTSSQPPGPHHAQAAELPPTGNGFRLVAGPIQQPEAGSPAQRSGHRVRGGRARLRSRHWHQRSNHGGPRAATTRLPASRGTPHSSCSASFRLTRKVTIR